MTRLIVLGLLLVILWLALRNFALQLKAAVFGQVPGRPAPPASRAAAETLVPCVRCGTYVVAARAFKGTAGTFCSEACRESEAKPA